MHLKDPNAHWEMIEALEYPAELAVSQACLASLD
jgi:hypothetical protein